MTANDDLATAVRPAVVVAVVPVHGRLPLLPITIKRLIRRNECKVVCVGDGIKEKEICLQNGAHWVQYRNKPLGAKWNAGFRFAKELNPDAVLYVGSSDWLSSNWIDIMMPQLKKYQIVGVPGCYFVDVRDRIRAVNWKGYVGQRANESIGIGRLLSRELMDLIDWEPFHSDKDSSLDHSMKIRCKNVGFDDVMIVDDRLKAVSLSTGQWENKHNFDQHWMERIPQSVKINPELLLKEFPELIELQHAVSHQ